MSVALASPVVSSHGSVGGGGGKGTSPTQFAGTRLVLSQVPPTLKLEGPQLQEWIRFIQGDPLFIYCPVSDMKLGQGGVVSLVWYREGTDKPELRLVKWGIPVPPRFKDVEIFDDKVPGCDLKVWQDRLTALMASEQ